MKPSLEVQPILVIVTHPCPTTVEITPEGSGVYRIHGFKAVREDDEYYISKWHRGEVEYGPPDTKDRIPPMMRGVKITHFSSSLPPIRSSNDVIDLDEIDDGLHDVPLTTFSKLAPITMTFDPEEAGPFSLILFIEEVSFAPGLTPALTPQITEGPNATISYVTYDHPTEGLLLRTTYHLGHGTKPWQQGWRRCQKDGAPCSADEAAKNGLDTTGIAFRDDGPVGLAPDLVVEVVDGDTDGKIDDDGIAISWGGMCPVQGTGRVDGKTIYYRARGVGWSVDIAEETPEEWSYEEAPYIWPDGGWLKPSISEANIRKAVAKWREHQKGNRA